MRHTTKDTVTEIAKRSGIPPEQIALVMESLQAFIQDEVLHKGNEVMWKNFGVFNLGVRQGGRRELAHGKVEFGETKRIRFKMSKQNRPADETDQADTET